MNTGYDCTRVQVIVLYGKYDVYTRVYVIALYGKSATAIVLRPSAEKAWLRETSAVGYA